MLHAQAVHGHRRRFVVVHRQAFRTGGEHWEALRSRGQAGAPVRARGCQVRVPGTGVVDERCIGRGVVHVVALRPLKERAEAATQYRLAVPEQVFREPDTGLPGGVLVLHFAARNAFRTGHADAIQIERQRRCPRVVRSGNGRAGRIDGALPPSRSAVPTGCSSWDRSWTGRCSAPRRAAGRHNGSPTAG